MNEDLERSKTWLWLTLPIAILLTIAAGGGVFIRDLYRDKPFYTMQAVGQDHFSLLVAMPILVVSALLIVRGSIRARLVWLGTLAYVVYTYVIAALASRFNPLFLVYVALLGCSLYALIGGLITSDFSRIKAAFSKQAPVKSVSLFLGLLAVLFYSVWLSEVLPASIAGTIPQSVQENGTPSNAVHVLDMAWILPAFALSAANLWRGRALGYTLAGVSLSFATLLLFAILSMVVFMFQGGIPISFPQLGLFTVLSVLSLGMLVWYLGELKPSGIRRPFVKA